MIRNNPFITVRRNACCLICQDDFYGLYLVSCHNLHKIDPRRVALDGKLLLAVSLDVCAQDAAAEGSKNFYLHIVSSLFSGL